MLYKMFSVRHFEPKCSAYYTDAKGALEGF
jgi:hypothetical protein